MAHKYGIALAEMTMQDLESFDIVTVPRSNMFTIVTEYSEPIPDGTGQIEPIPLRWANGWIVEAHNWLEAHTNAIRNAIIAYNVKYPGFPIPDDTIVIWGNGINITAGELTT